MQRRGGRAAVIKKVVHAAFRKKLEEIGGSSNKVETGHDVIWNKAAIAGGIRNKWEKYLLPAKAL